MLFPLGVRIAFFLRTTAASGEVEAMVEAIVEDKLALGS